MGASERLAAALDAIAATNGDWNIVTAIDAAGAREAARASDARADRPLGPLDGVIVGVKDNIAVRGLPWTAGLAAWRTRIATDDAEVVARLRAAGAVILGTLNMHEGALGATTDNPAYGRCANPLDPARTPGGSSGGSGAAVAAGYVQAALGTDTMGSVRIPAAYCGTFGLKPTSGVVPSRGLADLSPSLDSIGVLTGDPGLLRSMHRVLADPPNRAAPAASSDLLRIAVPRQIASVEVEPEIAEGLEKARAAFERIGLAPQEIDLAGWEPGRARRGGLLLTEAEGAVALAEAMSDPAGMSDDLRGLLDYGRALPSGRLVEALARIRTACRAAHTALRDVDVLLLPTAPQRAFVHGGAVPSNQADFTSLANFAGLPALALPIPGYDSLPASVQLIGRRHTEPHLLDLADRLAAALQP